MKHIYEATLYDPNAVTGKITVHIVADMKHSEGEVIRRYRVKTKDKRPLFMAMKTGPFEVIDV